MIASRRTGRYERIYNQLNNLITGKSPDLTAAMSTISAVMHFKLTHHFWTGFYLVKNENTLVVGPYQGPVACQILQGRGLCLKAAQTGEPVVVADVTRITDHIACDSRSLSEIVIPLIKDHKVVAVFDIDAAETAQFDEDDIAPLERIVGLLGPFL